MVIRVDLAWPWYDIIRSNSDCLGQTQPNHTTEAIIWRLSRLSHTLRIEDRVSPVLMIWPYRTESIRYDKPWVYIRRSEFKMTDGACSHLNHPLFFFFCQHGALMPPGQHSEQLENVKKMKLFLDRVFLLFQLSKSNIQPPIKERLPYLEKQLMGFIASNRRKVALQRQGQQQFPHPVGDAQSM